MPERDIVRDILKYLRSDLGAFAEKTHGSAYQRTGLPDIVACVPVDALRGLLGQNRTVGRGTGIVAGGLFVAIEVKQPGGKPTALQVRCLTEIQDSTGCAFVAHSVEETEEQLIMLASRLEQGGR